MNKMKGMEALETHNLTKAFGGVVAIDRISVSFPKNAITAIIGPNGSGKTTLVNILSGIYGFDNGSILIRGAPIQRMRPSGFLRHGLTRTFQEVRLFEQMSVRENIIVVLTKRHPVFSLFEFSSKKIVECARKILERVGLGDQENKNANELSYGQRKLLEIGRALALAPRVIFFDEPFAGLFPAMVEQVAEIMKQLRTEGITQILIEHNMELVRALSDYIIVMDAGQILAQGNPNTVLSRREVMEAYLGE